MATIKDLSLHYTRPDWVRRINAMGDSVGGAERLIPLDPEELVRTAVESTGHGVTAGGVARVLRQRRRD